MSTESKASRLLSYENSEVIRAVGIHQKSQFIEVFFNLNL